MKSDNRQLVLALIDGKKPLNSTGMVDTRLFKGGNTLRAIREPITSLWRVEYDDGMLPAPLKNKFTSFNKLMVFVTSYFERRNIKIEKIID